MIVRLDGKGRAGKLLASQAQAPRRGRRVAEEALTEAEVHRVIRNALGVRDGELPQLLVTGL